MRDGPMSAQEIQEYGQQIAYENAIAAEGERRHYREKELDMFFDWYFNSLDDLIRRDPSDAYEQFHEMRLGLGLTENECDSEKALYLER